MVEKSFALLKVQLVRIENSFLKAVCDKELMRRPQRWYYLEGLLSQAWQSWCNFARSYSTTVVRGHTFKSGNTIAPFPWAISNDAARYNLSRIASNASLVQNYQSKFLERKEMTWGDVSKLLQIFIELKMSHERDVLKSPEAASLKDFQNIRNYCAHLTKENFANLLQLSTGYKGNGLLHPTDLMLWESKGTNEFAFIQWLTDAQIISELLSEY